MPVMDEFKEEREALKHGTPKQKWTYFWDYYKLHVIVGVIAIAVVSSFIYQLVTKKEVAFYACMLNLARFDILEENPAVARAFAEYADIDIQKNDLLFDNSIQIGTGTGDDYNSSQKLMVYIAAGEIDTIVTDTDSALKYAYSNYFYDLRELLSPEQIKKYQDSFYYIDGAVAEELQRASSVNTASEPEYPSPTHPEEMQNPIPVGLILGETNPLTEEYYFYEKPGMVGVMLNTKHTDTAVKFLDFVMKDTK